MYTNKLKAANNLDEIIISSTNYINEALNHPRKDNIKQFARGNVLMQIGNNQYSAEVIIGFTGGNNMLLYDLINLKSTSFTIKKTDASTAQQKTNSEDSRLNASATNMISQNSKNVNERFSKAADTARENITEQAEVQNDEKIKYGFAGEYAKNADLSLLDRAKLMDENNSEWLVNDDGKNNINDLIKEAVALETTGKTGFFYLDKKEPRIFLRGQGTNYPADLKIRVPISLYALLTIVSIKNQ